MNEDLCVANYWHQWNTPFSGFFFIISVTAFLNILYLFIRESSFLFTAKSWILSLLYISLTISLVIQGFDLTFNREVFTGACLSETHKKALFQSSQFISLQRPFSKSLDWISIQLLQSDCSYETLRCCVYHAVFSSVKIVQWKSHNGHLKFSWSHRNVCGDWDL